MPAIFVKGKKCKVCGGSGPFYTHPTCPDGLGVCCECHLSKAKTRAKDPNRKAAAMWRSMRNRSENADGNNPTYKNVKLKIEKDEFVLWAAPLIQKFVQLYPNQIPSVDRINGGDYKLDNLQIISLEENVRKRAYNKNVHAPAGMAWCPSCEQYKSTIKFGEHKSKANGLQTYCNECRTVYRRKRRELGCKHT